jgi:hypothetical protein
MSQYFHHYFIEIIYVIDYLTLLKYSFKYVYTCRYRTKLLVLIRHFLTLIDLQMFQTTLLCRFEILHFKLQNKYVF